MAANEQKENLKVNTNRVPRLVGEPKTPAASRSLRKLIIATGLCGVSFACSSANNPGSTGASTTGGAGAAGTHTGGGAATTGTGGSGAQVGGTSAASSTGGSPSGQGGNTAEAGASTGGATAGSSATGGSTTGGNSAATGGAATGGAATGGNSSPGTGGAATGGAATGGAATGGAATGGAATGGTSSCAPTTPTMVSSSDYQIKVCNVTLDVNPQIGARIFSLTLGSTNIISPFTCTTYDANSTNCNNSAGSTFWTSPQSGWDGTVGGSNVWPPLAAIDGNPYTPSTSGNVLTLTGSADPTLGASVTKAISADSATGWITLTFTINTQGKALSAAPWQITRVGRGGIVLFPLMSLISNTTSPQWVLLPSGGYEWIDDTNQTSVVSTSGAKIIADGGVTGQSYTWLAYAEPPPSGQTNWNLFLIKYPDVAQSAFAPGESDTEVYPGSGYIELEAQGAYSTIAANSSSSPWTVQWRVAPIPNSVTVAAGSTTLASFAQQQAAM